MGKQVLLALLGECVQTRELAKEICLDPEGRSKVGSASNQNDRALGHVLMNTRYSPIDHYTL